MVQCLGIDCLQFYRKSMDRAAIQLETKTVEAPNSKEKSKHCRHHQMPSQSDFENQKSELHSIDAADTGKIDTKQPVSPKSADLKATVARVADRILNLVADLPSKVLLSACVCMRALVPVFFFSFSHSLCVCVCLCVFVLCNCLIVLIGYPSDSLARTSFA